MKLIINIDLLRQCDNGKELDKELEQLLCKLQSCTKNGLFITNLFELQV
jgi:hypothetical protein